MTSVPQGSLATSNTEIRSRYASGLLNPKASKLLGVTVSYPVRLKEFRGLFFYVIESSSQVGLARNKQSEKENDIEVVLATILAPLQELSKEKQKEILKQKRFVYLAKEKNIFKFHASSQELGATVVLKIKNEYYHSKKKVRFETLNENEENDLLRSYKFSGLNK